MVWYGPLFGKKWAAIIGTPMPTKEEAKKMQKQMIPLYLLNFLVSFIMFYGFGFLGGLLSAFLGNITVIGALILGFFVWFTFFMPIHASGALWSGKSKKHSWEMFFLTTGYQLVTILLGGMCWALIYPHFM
jgi:hypothetical protein